MSVRIVGNTIFMTRGDTLKVKVNIFNTDGTEYIPTSGDKIRFSLKDNYSDDIPLIIKEIPYDTCELHLDSADTMVLEQPHNYVYDIQITLTDGTVDTFITKAKLKILKGVEIMAKCGGGGSSSRKNTRKSTRRSTRKRSRKRR